ncbi:hypothetical protein ATY76_13385 [Rhizobium sp. R339]|uniref:hypothetical protein n=1 Tax=Rhizobium sp. R339 TaxID=1764273 RepID=UPI000B52DF03|nr:hypothetical protein [Rhizobium sp. R339]OWV67915.1 hypothetical protein ATY76_13385 [Rhizobium sp. R339]
MNRKIPYAGAEHSQPRSAACGAVGARGIALMRRVMLAQGPYRLESNRDRDALGRVLVAGFAVRDRRDEDVIHLADSGRAFLNRLMRAE